MSFPSPAEAREPGGSGIPAPDPLLDTSVRQVVAGADAEHPYGRPGRPVSRRAPLRQGFVASLGVGLAYLLLREMVDLREELLLAALAVVLAVGLEPLVEWLARHLPRPLAVAGVLLVLLGLFGGFLAAAVPPLTVQAGALVHHAPDYLASLVHRNGAIAALDHRYHLVDALRRQARQGMGAGLSAFGGLLGVGKVVISAATQVVTVTVLLGYLLANFPRLKRGAYRLLPRSRRARVGLISDGILQRVGGWVLTDFVTSIIAGTATFLFLLLTGVPYPLALGLFVAVVDLVPLVGFGVGALVSVAVALLTSLPVGLGCVVFFAAYSQLEQRVLIGRLLPRPAQVSPLVTLLAALVGGVLFGVLGVALAVPLAAGGQLVVEEVLLPRQDRQQGVPPASVPLG